ncbi:hypothetical protein BGZ74_007988 [Mortierella antarctica]|nr:hypothetical protein BGZ74_007988 [Mortierella antarctica]
MTGGEVPVNETEALKRYQLAAKDHADAQNTMGLHYYDTDPIAAEEWFLKAAKQGYREARSNLGQLMFSQGRYDKAEEWFRKLASSGDAHAQYCLGEMYFRGWYVGQDDTEALRLFSNAAVQGHMDAEHSLGYMYQHGRGTGRDAEEAEKWFLKALEQGHIASRKHIEEMRNYKATCEWGQRAEQPIFSMDGDGKYLDMTEVRLMLDELTESPPGLKEYVLHVVEEINKHYNRP